MKTFFINMLLLFTATLSFAQVPNYVPSNGLVAWWPFSGNAIDSSGNGNNGTVNGATLTTDRNGQANKAYSFDGVNDFITSGTNGIPSTGSLSVSVWAYFYQNNGIAEYLCLGSGSSTSWGAFAGTDWNGSPYLALNYGRGCSGSGISNVAVSPLLNTWQHIVYVSTGVGGLCKVYLNGNYVGQSNNGSTGGCSNANIYFGVDIFGPNFINCILDEIGIWNRALSQQEITDLYNSCQLSINSQTLSQISNVNDNAEFIVGSTVPNATYQWQTDLGFGFVNLNSGGQYSGANNDTLIVNNVSTANNNQTFRCIVIDGSCSDTSDIATLSVCSGISLQPNNQNAIVGNNVLFTSSTIASAAGYQWQTDLGFGFVNLSNSGQYNGTTNDTLTVSNVSLTNNNQQFRCIVSAGLCSDTSDIALLTITSSTNVIELSNNILKIYPNPATSQTRLELQLNQAQDFEIAVYNNLGQRLFNKNFSNTKELSENIDMRSWPAGQYFVEIKLPNGTETKKLIKE
jgi:hypothetical protein